MTSVTSPAAALVPVPHVLPRDGGEHGGSAVFVSPAYDQALTPALQALARDAVGYAASQHAANTQKGYASAWRVFTRWCAAHGRAPLPVAIPDLILCVTDWANAGVSVRTIGNRLAAIIDRHRRERLTLDLRREPAFREVWTGIRREKGRPKVRKAPILVDTLRALVATQPDTLLGVRNRALLLVAFTSLWRRSELSGLVWGRVLPSRLGPATLLVLPRAKADQEGHGTETPIFPGANPATCPVLALEAWRRALVAAGASVEPDTPVFRPVTRHSRVLPRALTAESIGDVVERAVAQAKATLEATARALEVQEPAASVAERRLAWTAVAALHQLDAGRIDAWEHYARERAAVRAERAAARRAARLCPRARRRRSPASEHGSDRTMSMT